MSRAGARYLCDSCGRDLSHLRLAEPCLCGAFTRRRVDSEEAVYRRPATADGPRWDPLKDWTAKYLQLLWNLQQLRRMYAPDSIAAADEVRLIVETSFAATLGLADWITAGPEPASVTPGDVTRLFEAEPLSICTAFGSADPAVHARVLPVAFSRPPHFWVEYRRPHEKPVRYDALDLLERCLRAWDAFLTGRGVQLPSWSG